jgi:hypothetical protein
MFIKGVHDAWLLTITRNDRWFAHLHIQNDGSKRIWILTYSWKKLSVSLGRVRLLWTCIGQTKVHADMACKRPFYFLIWS